ncbi:hypothetical protein M4D71_23355 [Niallia taxi]|uniref:hypothetical protein n=1 Tax=Niallia taxi TaxID=2499688 RepID=UPI0021A51696|nr:hypothetical protein [Niallia taxi]MCT2347092.1 hypothetical protein [Niallia taxi]
MQISLKDLKQYPSFLLDTTVSNECYKFKVKWIDENNLNKSMFAWNVSIHSTIRDTLMPNVKPRYAGYTCWRAVVQTEPNLRGFNPKVFIETWVRKGRFGLGPLQDNRIYGFSYVNAKVKNSPLRNFTVQNLGEIFEGYHDPIPEILAQTSDNQLLQHDIYDLPPINHFVFGNIVLLGDSAYSMTPNLGQGAEQPMKMQSSLQLI